MIYIVYAVGSSCSLGIWFLGSGGSCRCARGEGEGGCDSGTCGDMMSEWVYTLRRVVAAVYDILHSWSTTSCSLGISPDGSGGSCRCACGEGVGGCSGDTGVNISS